MPFFSCFRKKGIFICLFCIFLESKVPFSLNFIKKDNFCVSFSNSDNVYTKKLSLFHFLPQKGTFIKFPICLLLFIRTLVLKH